MSAKTEGIAPNASRLLWAGFMAILAAGVGFAIRGGIFDNWAKEFGFTGAQLGAIGGAGLHRLLLRHHHRRRDRGQDRLRQTGRRSPSSATSSRPFVTFAASTPAATPTTACIWGMFIFAFANGTLEAVANPLVATLFPENRTHYLNILHASWPAGMVLGSRRRLGSRRQDAAQLEDPARALSRSRPSLYGIMFLGQNSRNPKPPRKASSFGEMFKDVGILGAARRLLPALAVLRRASSVITRPDTAI